MSGVEGVVDHIWGRESETAALQEG
jgi:hypothetical protein